LVQLTCIVGDPLLAVKPVTLANVPLTRLVATAEPEPKFEDGIVKTSLGRPFAIVHQYDRVPEWKEFIKQKYQ
jgi:hypothetical protein